MEPLEDDTVPRMDLSEFQPLSGPSGTTPPDHRPGFASLAEMSTSPSTSRTVWGTHAIVASSPELEATQRMPGEFDDGWLREEDFLGTAELTIQIEAIKALEGFNGGPSSSAGGGSSTINATSSGGGNGGTGATGGGAGGGKKKKKQKITLMSTGGRRGN